MSFDQFITKYTGVGVDTDGAYGYQCMDLMHKYCQDVLGLADLKILAAPAAKDVWLTNAYGKDKFEIIPNTPTGVPQKGDIIFWGTGLGPYGHVAIFIQGDVNSFRSFDQNFPTGSKCTVTNHPSYNGVLGWLRYKQPVVSDPVAAMQKQLDEMRKQRDENWQLFQIEKTKTASLTTQLTAANEKAARLENFRNQVEELCNRFSR